MTFFKDHPRAALLRLRLFPLAGISIALGFCFLAVMAARADDATQSKEPTTNLKWIPASQRQPGSGDPKAPPNPLKVIFKNKTENPVKLHWFRPRDSKRILYETIPAGGKRAEKTYRGAVWIITDTSDKVLGYFKVRNTPAIAEIPAETDRSGKER